MGNESKIEDIRTRLNAAFPPEADEEAKGNVTELKTEFPLALRMLEALLFAASEPLDEATLIDRLPTDIELPQILAELRKRYESRGVNLICVGGRWQFRTAPDLAFLMQKERIEPRKLSRAAIETLAIVAYHQPITRLEIEEIRGVSVSKGTLDVLLETGWVRLRGRRRSPGRPVCYGTSQTFLEHFGLETVKDLPGLEELKSAGLLSSRLPPSFVIPSPDDDDDAELDPLEDEVTADLFDGEAAPEGELAEATDAEAVTSENAMEAEEELSAASEDETSDEELDEVEAEDEPCAELEDSDAEPSEEASAEGDDSFDGEENIENEAATAELADVDELEEDDLNSDEADGGVDAATAELADVDELEEDDLDSNEVDGGADVATDELTDEDALDEGEPEDEGDEDDTPSAV